MRPTAAIFLAGWTAWLVVLTVLLWLFAEGPLPIALLSASALGWALIALFAWRRPGEPERRSVTDSSLATIITASGFVMAVLGAVFGLWLSLIGAETMLAGAVWLWLEGRGGHRAKGSP